MCQSKQHGRFATMLRTRDGVDITQPGPRITYAHMQDLSDDSTERTTLTNHGELSVPGAQKPIEGKSSLVTAAMLRILLRKNLVNRYHSQHAQHFSSIENKETQNGQTQWQKKWQTWTDMELSNTTHLTLHSTRVMDGNGHHYE